MRRPEPFLSKPVIFSVTVESIRTLLSGLSLSHWDKSSHARWAQIIVLGVLAQTGIAAAQDSVVIEEIIVTAQKREQSLSDVGITVNAFSAQDIKDNRILSSQDIAANTPNLTIVN